MYTRVLSGGGSCSDVEDHHQKLHRSGHKRCEVSGNYMLRFIQFRFPGVFVSVYTGCILRLKRTFRTYTLLHELACNIASYCTSGRGIFTSRRRVKMQPTSAITAICTLTSVIKYLLSITTTASCLFSHKVPSSSPFERTGSN